MSKLYIVPTPIGNLEDITLRAIRILKEADLILAEDTRTSSKLLRHLEISKPMIAYHLHNEHRSLAKVIERLQLGETIALISDAGTPAISDPGFLVVRECIANNIPVECLPGPSALIVAVVNSGLPCDRFIFEGFLPQKKGRQTRIMSLVEESRTMVFYESPHRLIKALEQFIEHFGPERRVCVSRELTKMFEENARGTLSEVLAHFKAKDVKGEIVIVLEGKDKGRKKEEED